MRRKLQVFVSSTYTDLIEERQAAVAAILKAGHIPAGMELFTAGDQAQMEIIKKWIDESDVYMLILGGRYGSLISDSETSYTEWEYDYAVEQGKPLFAVVINEKTLDEKIKAKGRDGFETVNPQLLQKFREKVLSKQSAFFSDNKDIRLCVSESLVECSNRADLKGWISGSEVEDTMNLRDELQRLRDENYTLKASLLKTNSEAKPNPDKVDLQSKFDELSKILIAIKIEVPALEYGNSRISGNSTTNILDFFYSYQSFFINGTSNFGSETTIQGFCYQLVCPRLQIHGLVKNGPGMGRERLSFITPYGEEFLAYIDKKKHLANLD